MNLNPDSQLRATDYNSPGRGAFRLLLVAAMIWMSAPLQAFVLDWDTVTSGGTTNLPTLPASPGSWSSTTYNNVDGSGIDVTVSFRVYTPDGSSITVDTVADYVDRNTPIVGDTTGAGIRIQFDANNSSPYVRTRIRFSEPVRNLNLEIWDVDRSSWRDEIRDITGRTIIGSGGVNFDPASITPASTNTVGHSTTANSVTVNENPNPDNPSTSDGGADVLINFGSTSTQQVRFDYGNNPTGVGDPSGQLIWFSAFNFEPVPEPSTYVTGAFLVVLAGFAWWHKRRQE
jgi:hypothetical protein